jgi:hypothetical protein
MDLFKSTQHSFIVPGGLKCSCCNKFTGKDKQKLNRLTRHRLKAEDKKNENHIYEQ